LFILGIRRKKLDKRPVCNNTGLFLDLHFQQILFFFMYTVKIINPIPDLDTLRAHPELVEGSERSGPFIPSFVFLRRGPRVE